MEGSRTWKRVVGGEEWIGGVCGGLAYWLGVPAWLVRFLWAVAVLMYGTGLVLYVLLWIFIPKWDEVPRDYKEATGG
ncbi:MAG: PspC domain-containing protein [Candidatus Moranbacteria bacterium]|nr:PspC domain-containing protein [Candidatus Moranbacteria bacterium]